MIPIPEFKTDENSTARSVAHTRLFVDGKECGIIVYDDTDDAFDIWLAVRRTDDVKEGHIPWHWIHAKTRPPTCRHAKDFVIAQWGSLTTKHQLHYFT